MDHLVVDRDAEVAGIAVVVVEAGPDVVLLAVVDDERVDLAGGDAGRDGGGADVADLRAHPARLAHPVDFRARLDVDLQDVLPGNDVGELEGVGLTPCEVDVHRALEGVRHVLDPREEVAVQVEGHVVGGHRGPHEVRQDDPGEIQLRVGVYPDADAVLAGVRQLQRVGPGDPLAGELHLQGVLAVGGERRQDVNLGTLGAELQLRAGIQRPAARRSELHKRIVIHEVVEGVLPVLTSLEVQAQGVGHVFRVPDDVPRDLEAEVPEGDFAVELRAAAQQASCRSDYCKEGVFQGIHGA